MLDDNATPTLTAINEDAGAPGVGAGTLVSQLVDLTPPVGGIDNVTDADFVADRHRAHRGRQHQRRLEVLAQRRQHLDRRPGVSDNSALLLAADADTRLYFQPNANFNGTSSITFRAWDQTDGHAEGSAADPTPAGDSTAYSLVFDTAGITVNAVNNAPQFAGLNGTPTFTEDGPAVVLDNNATISDVDLDAANDYGGATSDLGAQHGTNADDIFSDDNGTLTFGATDVSLGGLTGRHLYAHRRHAGDHLRSGRDERAGGFRPAATHLPQLERQSAGVGHDQLHLQRRQCRRAGLGRDARDRHRQRRRRRSRRRTMRRRSTTVRRRWSRRSTRTPARPASAPGRWSPRWST